MDLPLIDPTLLTTIAVGVKYCKESSLAVYYLGPLFIAVPKSEIKYKGLEFS